MLGLFPVHGMAKPGEREETRRRQCIAQCELIFAHPGFLRAAHGVLVPFVRYPGGAEGGAFRITVTAAHTEADVAQLVEAWRVAL